MELFKSDEEGVITGWLLGGRDIKLLSAEGAPFLQHKSFFEEHLNPDPYLEHISSQALCRHWLEQGTNGKSQNNLILETVLFSK